jgi:choline dehydrogenase-like flavoprotein
VTGVEYVDRVTGQRGTLQGRCVVLAAGSLSTPHLLLASELDRVSPACEAVGRYLTRHCNAVAFGAFRRRLNPHNAFEKQVAIHDFYHGVTDSTAPVGPLGSLQQMTPPLGLVRAWVPAILRGPASFLMSRASGILTMAEDQPRLENGVHIDHAETDRFGLPRLVVRHHYTARDRSASRVLVERARAVLKEAGAFATWVHTISTFSHALGTVRMGPDERSAPLDVDGRYRGLDNLFVADGSALPRSAGVNPSLTIAANSLRIGRRLACSLPSARAQRRLPIHARSDARDNDRSRDRRAGRYGIGGGCGDLGDVQGRRA